MTQETSGYVIRVDPAAKSARWWSRLWRRVWLGFPRRPSVREQVAGLLANQRALTNRILVLERDTERLDATRRDLIELVDSSRLQKEEIKALRSDLTAITLRQRCSIDDLASRCDATLGSHFEDGKLRYGPNIPMRLEKLERVAHEPQDVQTTCQICSQEHREFRDALLNIERKLNAVVMVRSEKQVIPGKRGTPRKRSK